MIPQRLNAIFSVLARQAKSPKLSGWQNKFRALTAKKGQPKSWVLQ